MRAPLLYLAYGGMLEPLGQSQVLAYLEKLAAQLAQAGMGWLPSPGSTP